MDFEDVKVSDEFELTDVVRSVKSLQKIAKNLRQKRLEMGAISFGTSQLYFKLDEAKTTALDFAVHERKESNSLVEEFMLLANISVARFISDAFPHFAPLRHHPPPKRDVIENLSAWLMDHAGIVLRTEYAPNSFVNDPSVIG